MLILSVSRPHQPDFQFTESSLHHPAQRGYVHPSSGYEPSHLGTRRYKSVSNVWIGAGEYIRETLDQGEFVLDNPTLRFSALLGSVRMSQ